MNQKNKFEVMTRASSAIEKASPQVRRILTKMVEDTLVLAAAAWFRRGEEYYNGIGVPQDYAEAVRWYGKAAKRGNKLAQFGLGMCYEEGQGVSRNYCEAYKFYKLASDGDAIEARLDHLIIITEMELGENWQGRLLSITEKRRAKGLANLRTRMTDVEIVEGERRYHEFRLG